MTSLAPAASPQPLPPKRGGGCCCGMGCLTLLVVAFFGLALLIGGTWFLIGRTLKPLTSNAPITLQLEEPSNAQFATASEKLERVRNATRTNQSVTIEFTAADLNALIARHEMFNDLQRKVHVGIADSLLKLNVSVPLESLELPGFRHRWFNGSVSFGLVYDEDRFALAVKSLSANGRNINLSPFQRLANLLNDSFNKGFDSSQRRERESTEFWENVKSIGVFGDKLIIITKGGEIVGRNFGSRTAASR